MSRSGRIHRAPLAIAGAAHGRDRCRRRRRRVLRRRPPGELARAQRGGRGGPRHRERRSGRELPHRRLRPRDVSTRTSRRPRAAGSDSIMILRRDPDHGAALLSIPRDLWVPIAGRGDEWKINAAFNGGADRLVQTIQQSLGIPIHHYIEVDFDGFARLVDTVGGVEICVRTPPGRRLGPRHPARLPDARRRHGAGVRAVAPLHGVDRRRVGRGQQERLRADGAPADVPAHGRRPRCSTS